MTSKERKKKKRSRIKQGSKHACTTCVVAHTMELYSSYSQPYIRNVNYIISFALHPSANWKIRYALYDSRPYEIEMKCTAT